VTSLNNSTYPPFTTLPTRRSPSCAPACRRQGCEFWTADKVFYDTVKAVLTFVKYLPDYP